MISTRRGKDLDPNVRNFLLSSTHYNPQMLLENNPLLSSFLSLSCVYAPCSVRRVFFTHTQYYDPCWEKKRGKEVRASHDDDDANALSLSLFLFSLSLSLSLSLNVQSGVGENGKNEKERQRAI